MNVLFDLVELFRISKLCCLLIPNSNNLSDLIRFQLLEVVLAVEVERRTRPPVYDLIRAFSPLELISHAKLIKCPDYLFIDAVKDCVTDFTYNDNLYTLPWVLLNHHKDKQ